ncbi:MAG: hypothetical protein HYV36_01595 [Lentisphaerae bacterium]|nr:hypothetical protein [Lentisphaerota bacterium]
MASMPVTIGAAGFFPAGLFIMVAATNPPSPKGLRWAGNSAARQCSSAIPDGLLTIARLESMVQRRRTP